MINLIAYDRKAGNAFFVDDFGRLKGLTHEQSYASVTDADLERAHKYLSYERLNVSYPDAASAAAFLAQVKARVEKEGR